MIRAAALAIVLVSSAPRMAAAAGDIPSRFLGRNPYRTTALWTSAKEAISRDGSVASGVAEPHEMTILRSAMERHARIRAEAAEAPSDCAVTFGALFDDAPGMVTPRSLSELKDLARGGSV